MAACFRNVSNKLCCASYLKAANVIYSENTIGLRKSAQPDPEKWNCLLVQNTSLVPEIKSLCAKNMYYKQNSLIPRNPEYLAVNNLAVLHYRESDTNTLSAAVSNHEQILLRSTGVDDNKSISKKPKPAGGIEGRPSEEQLEAVYQELSKSLPKIFVVPLRSEFYHPDIILENNFKNKRTVGYGKYLFQLSLVKALAHLKFAYVKANILKMTKHPEDGTIKCRWRVVGIPGLAVIFQFWKFTPSNVKSKVEDAPTWIDGFSIYYVGSDGRIGRHIVDKMQPDDHRVDSNAKSTIAPKVAMFLGLLKESEEALDMCAVDPLKKVE